MCVAGRVPRGSENANGRVSFELLLEEGDAVTTGSGIRVGVGAETRLGGEVRVSEGDDGEGGGWRGAGGGLRASQAADGGEVAGGAHGHDAGFEVDSRGGAERPHGGADASADGEGGGGVGVDRAADRGVDVSGGGGADDPVGAERVEGPAAILREDARRRRQGGIEALAVRAHAVRQESLHRERVVGAPRNDRPPTLDRHRAR